VRFPLAACDAAQTLNNCGPGEAAVEGTGRGASGAGQAGAERVEWGACESGEVNMDSIDAAGEPRAIDASFKQNGVTKVIYEAIFPTDQTNTVYRGESGKTAWASTIAGAKPIDVRGFGRVTNLAVAAANDFELADLVAQRAEQMTTPDLRTLVNLAGDVLLVAA
jgi:hypothetical protein